MEPLRKYRRDVLKPILFLPRTRRPAKEECCVQDVSIILGKASYDWMINWGALYVQNHGTIQMRIQKC